MKYLVIYKSRNWIYQLELNITETVIESTKVEIGYIN